MTTIRLNNTGTPYFEVKDVTNFNEFMEWMYTLDETDMSMAYNGSLYRFHTPEERLQFVFGFKAAWEAMRDKYLETHNGEV